MAKWWGLKSMRPHPIVGAAEAAFGKHSEGLSRTCILDLQSAQVKMSVRVSVPENKPTFSLRDSAFKEWA